MQASHAGLADALIMDSLETGDGEHMYSAATLWRGLIDRHSDSLQPPLDT
jgi:hypothetical protein